jgi:hypothetical protein
MALTQGYYPGDWLIDEFGAPNFCREERILASGQNLQAGAVVALGSGTTVSAYIDDDGTYGDVEGILMESVDATDAAKACVVLVRGPAVVDKSKLHWHANNDSTEITAGLALLLVKHIVAREGV